MLEQLLELLKNISFANLSIVISTFALLISFVMMLRFSALSRSIAMEKNKLETRLRIITSGAVGMGEKIIKLESRLADAVNGQLQAAEAEAQFSYTQALKLIESGVDHTVVMSNSGLSESEVNLMELLHQSHRDGRKVSHAG